MKKYIYKGKAYTLKQLELHPECRVAGHELRRNLWRKKLSVEEAMVRKIKLTRSRARKTYFYQGLEMTVAELSELPECKVTYYQLHKLLQKKVSLDKALSGNSEGGKIVSKAPKPFVETEKPKVLRNYIALGGSISFNPPPPPRTDMSYTYEWLVLYRLGYEMNKSGVNLTKTIDKMIE